MAAGQHKLSRRALLGAVCAAPVLSRHPGLDPGSTFSRLASPQGRWIPDQVRDDERAESFVVTIWDRALARFQKAQVAVDAASGEPNQERYDALVDSADESMCALLALPAPDLAALAAKLDLIVTHLAWELTGSEIASSCSCKTPTVSSRPRPDLSHAKPQRRKEAWTSSTAGENSRVSVTGTVPLRLRGFA